jgi:hypothetical protein
MIDTLKSHNSAKSSSIAVVTYYGTIKVASEDFGKKYALFVHRELTEYMGFGAMNLF